MSFGINGINNISFPNLKGRTANAQEFINKPIEKVDDVINKTVDTFVKEPEEEGKKKSKKAAITAGSTVLVLSALVALLNPKFSSKLSGKMKTIAANAEAKIQANKDSFIKTEFYKSVKHFSEGIAGITQFINTINSLKDVGFKWLCSADKFNKVENKFLKKILQTTNQGFTKVMTTVNDGITNWFDNLSKHTVFYKNKKAVNKMNDFDNIINVYKNRLSVTEQKILENKLAEVSSLKQYFAPEQTAERLSKQGDAMNALEQSVKDKFKVYCSGFRGFKHPDSFSNKAKHNAAHFKENMTFWAEDMLKPTKNIFTQDGNMAVDKLVGDGQKIKGKYNEIFELLSPHLNQEEKVLFEKKLGKVNKKLRKANYSECIEYFDKKRDLVLGGAPTDILSGIGVLGISGVAIGTADTKEDRISRALTLGFPAIAGLGTSLTLTAMLFSGTQGMLIGGLASTGMSKIGSTVDKVVNPRKPNITEAEVKYA